MGLTKQYLRYAAAGTFNIIASPQCNHAFITYNHQEGRYVAVGAAQHVFIWDMKLAEKVQVFNGDHAAASCIVFVSSTNHLAVGYSDGLLKIFDLNSGEVVNNFSGHRNQITAIGFDSEGHRIASGAKDNEIIIWDSVADAGVCRLSGHKDQITQIIFMRKRNNKYVNVLISASKDTFIKFWDLQTNHCFQTLTAHKTEVWDISLLKNEQYLVSGCSDAELRVWQLKLNDDDVGIGQQEGTDINTNDDLPVNCSYVGSILRAGKGRVVSLRSDSNGQILATHGLDHQIELFMFCDDQQVQTRVKKRLKKERSADQQSIQQTTSTEQITLKDQVRRLKSVKLMEKAKSVGVILGAGGEIRISTVLNKNSVALYSYSSLNQHVDAEPKCLRQIGGHHGHQTEIRSVDFSSDDLAMLSGSGDSIKVWNQTSQTCLRTVYTQDYVLCVCFVPGDRHALIGLKNGHLLIIDISVGDILEDIPAHDKELWSICVTPDLRGCVTGAGDCTLKFWNYQLIDDEESCNKTNTKVLSLLHTKTLKLEETVLAIKMSSNNKFIAVALLDSTVKIFFIDTLKFYLTLYGHKLPILCMDISYDSNIIVSGSADRNVKIWGLDFGDCHKSLFAHNDSVTAVQFINNTHYFFTSSRDGSIKQWDADSYQQITTLLGHIGQVNALTISPNGKYVLSCGSDFTLRLWERTDEMIVLEEEHQLQEQEQLATGDDTIVPGKGQVILATKKTIGSEKGAELIMECLQISLDYKQQLESSPGTTIAIPPMMQAFNVLENNVHDFIVAVFKSIRSSDLEESLLLLPFTNVCQLLELLATGGKTCNNDIELVMRIISVLVRIHSNAIQSSSKLIQTLKSLHKNLFMAAHNYRDTIAYNMHNLWYLQRELEQAEGVQLFRNATNQLNEKNSKTKRQRRKQRILIT
ncbi:WD repeat-containing protein 3 [Chrysoperla carnea]|uniref:WD repeat-containing protein 3 n=1 Tax=Chrysoperla carnea TaxID=189513 RepID=UPI001D067877|nr:WD repeat-containing protein 3 [Chrysoperla carnea]